MTERKLMWLDALIGMLIGVVTVTLRMTFWPEIEDRARYFALSAGLVIIMLAIPMFLATLMLAPLLIRYLKNRISEEKRRYYANAAAAGVFFGVAASGFAGLFFPAMLALLPSAPNDPFTLLERAGVALAGPLLFVPGFGLFAIIAFAIPLLITGMGFGLFNGYMVRKLEAR